MTVDTYLNTGLCIGLVAVAIFWCPMAMEVFRWAKCYVMDKEIQFRSKSIIHTEEIWDIEEAFVQFGLFMILFSILGVAVIMATWIVVAPICIFICIIYGILRGIRFAFRAKRAVSELGKVSHSHQGKEIIDNNIDPLNL